MNKKVFFRADAAPEIGLGHVRRCAVLAQACRELGAEIHLIARWHDVVIESAGDWTGAEIHEVPWDLTPDQDARWVVDLCRDLGLQRGVVDHYRQSESYQQLLIKAGIEWLQFGNTKHTHPLLGRWVHDASPGASAGLYGERLKVDKTVFLLGPAHALISPKFRSVRAGLHAPRECGVESVLVTFGGGDDRGATLRVLEWLDRAGYEGRRLVLTGANNPSLGQLQKAATQSSRIELEVGNWDPAELMAGNQLAICAGGTTLHEVACLGLPAAVVSIAENQVAPGLAWSDQGMGVYCGDLAGLSDEKAIAHLRMLLADRIGRTRKALRAWESQDGQGAARVAQVICGVAACEGN